MRKKKKFLTFLFSAFGLTLFDALATFYELKAGLAWEANTLLYFFQKSFGLNLWLIFHISVCILFVYVVYKLWRHRKIQRMATLYIWLTLEIILFLNHLAILFKLF